MPRQRTAEPLPGWSNNLRDARQVKGLRLKDVAARLGVHLISVSRWESMMRVPGLEMALRISKLYGVPVDMLWSIEDRNIPERADQLKLFDTEVSSEHDGLQVRCGARSEDAV